MLNYILPILTALVAVFQLAKDWTAHQTHWRRGTVIGLIVLLTIVGTVNVYYTNKRASDQRQKDHTEITALTTAVETANKNQEANTKQFVDAFGKMSQQVSDLQTAITTEALQKRLANVQLDLQNMQKALAPGPKAKLLFTFFPFNNGVMGIEPAVAITDVTLPLNPDGTVHFEFTVLNLTDVDAMDGQYTLIICDACTFAKETQGFTRLEGRPDTERYTSFAKIPAKSQGPILGKIDLFVPIGFDTIPIGLIYRCHTCDVPQLREGLSGTIHIRR